MVAYVSMKKLMEGIPYKICLGLRKQKITGITCSTKKVHMQSAFVCIHGTKEDGHRFASQAIQKGARLIIIERKSERLLQELQDTFLQCANAQDRLVVLLVANTRSAYARMCRNFFGRPDQDLIMIGITGTKGKTTTSIFLNALLKSKFRTGLIGTNGAFLEGEFVKTEQTTPDPYDIFELLYRMRKRGITHVIMEVSSQGLMQHRVEGIVFCLGLYLNLSRDHISDTEHHSMEEYIFWKDSFRHHCRHFLYNADDDSARESGKKVKNSYCFSMKKEKILALFSVKWENIEKDRAFGAYLFLRGSAVENQGRFYVPGAFDFVKENILAALSAAYLCGIDLFTAGVVLSTVQVKGRMQMIYASLELHVIIDYAHNETSLLKVLQALRSYHPKRLICVFGCGGDRAKERRFSMGRVAGQYADLILLTEDNSRSEPTEKIFEDIIVGIQESGGRYLLVPDRKEAIRYSIRNYQVGDFILFAGKGHEQYMLHKQKKVPFSEEELITKELRNMKLI